MSRLVLGFAILVFALAAGYVAAASALWYRTADFFCLWMGGRFAVLRVDPYDANAWAAATGGLFQDPRGLLLPASCPGRFAYPYWTAIALAPFGALPLEFAATLWMALAIVSAIGGALIAWSAAGGGRRGLPLFLALVLFSQPFWTLFASGQMGGVMLALAATLAWALVRVRSHLGGMALAGLLLKPQLGLLIIPLVVIEAMRRGRKVMLLTATATGCALALASFALAPAWPLEWFNEVWTQRLQEVAFRPTVWGFAGETFGAPAWGAIILAVLAMVIAVVGRTAAFAPVPTVAFGAALSLATTPYISTYDHLMLVLPWACMLANAEKAPPTARIALLIGILAAASVLPWVLFAIPVTGGSLTWSVAVPTAAVLVLVAALRLGQSQEANFKNDGPTRTTYPV